MSLATLAAKYSIAGFVNMVVGYAVIFASMAAGCSATLSNVFGYSAGLVVSFLQSRHWVFRSTDKATGDFMRFVPAFLLAFGANFLVLQVLLPAGVNPYVSQLLASVAFVAVSFALSYVFVFRQRKP